MNHHATKRFWKCYDSLPESIQRLADKNFALLKADPFHPSLHFKKVKAFWLACVGSDYRALALEEGDDLFWFRIGTHTEYDHLIR